MSALQRELRGIVRLGLKMETVTGLLIRMPVHAQVYRIGGADLYPIVTKRKYSLGGAEVEVEVPLVPGSSLKGRMRGLLELSLGKRLYTSDERIWLHARILWGTRAHPMSTDELIRDISGRCEVDEVFGSPAVGFDQLVEMLARDLASKQGKEEPDDADYEEAGKVARSLALNLALTRLLVDDMTPDKDYVGVLSENGRRILAISDFLEEKGENRIDRITSAADPRQVARVKPGVVFQGALRLLVFDIDKGYVKRNLELVAKGLRLVEETYLGASGSRGYGRVKFKDISVEVMKTFGAEKPEYRKLADLASVEALLGKVDEIAGEVEKTLFG
ncbi:type III-A CRISPR-associated RAMP protein Csm3 [Thermofilum pendens]|uniref:CRISPR system Cms endoribonuclease Csm3 n=1 Tax=Thermofilum pendens (strain DSM 2475 / Hrk 5) TaxID=368408 RepID=A1RZY1_THEPD|nr:type III-A CRISPR-associated RAMP protein Csm3 [Thermofilum pendens]ABL78761.1 CRISPR-associated RAMP protein, Csm3 family [Thermofilum pendens Hrk 5]